MATGTIESTVTDNEEAVTDETVQQKKNRLRNEAEREVLNKHRDELNHITEAKFNENNLPYTRRLTEREKAKKKIEDLLAEYPDLREEYAAN
jgi:ABC-type sugar transport system substrate-binding protein